MATMQCTALRYHERCTLHAGHDGAHAGDDGGTWHEHASFCAGTTGHLVATIGAYKLDAATDFSVPQEYAGAAQTVRVPAGTYPIEVRRDMRGHRYVCVPMPGTLVWDWFGGDSCRGSRPMTPYRHHLRPYAYQLATMPGATLVADWAEQTNGIV